MAKGKKRLLYFYCKLEKGRSSRHAVHRYMRGKLQESSFSTIFASCNPPIDPESASGVAKSGRLLRTIMRHVLRVFLLSRVTMICSSVRLVMCLLVGYTTLASAHCMHAVARVTLDEAIRSGGGVH